jgi:predicted nucleic acid-binding protein
MILADTSVWVDHFRSHNAALAALLDTGAVLIHPFVMGEIALGSLKQRRVILDGLAALPFASLANDDEVLAFVESRQVFGLGIGYVDCHLLASTVLTAGAKIWTFDKRLDAVATTMDLAMKAPPT